MIILVIRLAYSELRTRTEVLVEDNGAKVTQDQETGTWGLFWLIKVLSDLSEKVAEYNAAEASSLKLN